MYIRDDILQKYKVGHHASFGCCMWGISQA